MMYKITSKDIQRSTMSWQGHWICTEALDSTARSCEKQGARGRSRFSNSHSCRNKVPALGPGGKAFGFSPTALVQEPCSYTRGRLRTYTSRPKMVTPCFRKKFVISESRLIEGEILFTMYWSKWESFYASSIQLHKLSTFPGIFENHLRFDVRPQNRSRNSEYGPNLTN